MIELKASPEALAIASGAILAALLDALVDKKTITKQEVQALLGRAHTGVEARKPDSKAGFDASQFVAALTRNFSEHNV